MEEVKAHPQVDLDDLVVLAAAVVGIMVAADQRLVLLGVLPIVVLHLLGGEMQAARFPLPSSAWAVVVVLEQQVLMEQQQLVVLVERDLYIQ